MGYPYQFWEDICYLQRKMFNYDQLRLPEEQTETYTLFEIESLLLNLDKSLKDMYGMPLLDASLLWNLGSIGW